MSVPVVKKKCSLCFQLLKVIFGIGLKYTGILGAPEQTRH